MCQLELAAPSGSYSYFKDVNFSKIIQALDLLFGGRLVLVREKVTTKGAGDRISVYCISVLAAG